MRRLRRILTSDTARDITDLLHRAAREHGFDPAGLLGGALAESELREHALRERAWPDVSYGLWQPTVKWLGPEVPNLERAADGTARDTPGNRQAARAFCWDAARLTPYVAVRYAALLRRWGDPLQAWCRWNKPAIPGVDNPNRARYAESLQAAEAHVEEDGAMRDLRGQLPTNNEASYNTRPLDAVSGITLHYTAGPTGHTARDVAAFQTSEAARPQTGNNTPFPGIAYTFLIDGDGVANLCHDLKVRTWHSAAVVGGLPRNMTHVGICYTGREQPNRAQIRGLAEAIRWCEDQLGRRLALEGHRDAPYPTDCPGPVWPGWRSSLEDALRQRPSDVTPFVIGEGFRRFLADNPEWGKPRIDEQPMIGGAYLWTTPTAQHPNGGLLVYRAWLNEVRALAWE